MTTPNRKAIIEKALELWRFDQIKHGCSQLAEITPETEELRESGYISSAKSELMRDSYRSAVESKDYVENLEDFCFDLKLGLEQGTFISGGRGSGKSSLAKTITNIFLKENYVIRVFDNSQTWRRSNIPNLAIIKPYSKFEPQYNESYVFDISLLDIEQQKTFIENIVEREFNYTANLNENERNWRIYVFEECEILISTHDRSKKVLKLCAVGRNLMMTYIAIAQRFQMVSTNLISMSGQLYLGMTHEFNDLKRAYNWIGQNTKELAKLEVGQFIRYSKGNITKMNVELFTSEIKPKLIIADAELIEPLEAKTTNTNDRTIVSLLTLVCGIFFVISALAQYPR